MTIAIGLCLHSIVLNLLLFMFILFMIQPLNLTLKLHQIDAFNTKNVHVFLPLDYAPTTVSKYPVGNTDGGQRKSRK